VEEKKVLRKGADGRETELLAAWELPNRSCSVQMRATRVFIAGDGQDEDGMDSYSRGEGCVRLLSQSFRQVHVSS
jgi:hypothetical protein